MLFNSIMVHVGARFSGACPILKTKSHDISDSAALILTFNWNTVATFVPCKCTKDISEYIFESWSSGL